MRIVRSLARSLAPSLALGFFLLVPAVSGRAATGSAAEQSRPATSSA